jgi:galactonate dehydratase
LSNTITRLRLAATYVSRRTRWIFVRLTASDGSFGLSELTGADPELVADELRELQPRLIGREVTADRAELVSDLHARAAGRPNRRSRHTLAVLASGIDAAWADLAARAAGLPLWQYLGGRPLDGVDVYANINRGLWARTPQEFADTAAQAVAAGFPRIKCAPFDHLPQTGAELRRIGLDLLRAVRDAIGPDIELYVDAHAKLPFEETAKALPVFEELGVGWLEDAVPLDRPDLLREVRARTGLRLVGGEQTYTAADLLPALETGALDTVLLDVRYTGGFAALADLVALVSGAGIPVSLHNPAGPVATAASLHATASIPGDTVLEYAYGEADWRAEVTTPPEHVTAGRLVLPARPGLGLDLSSAHARFLPVDEFAAPAEPEEAPRHGR